MYDGLDRLTAAYYGEGAAKKMLYYTSYIGRVYNEKMDDEGNVLLIKNQHDQIHYQTNVAAMLKLGEWLDYLKKNGVYDNTRIIIVSDHGRDLEDDIMPVIEYVDGKNENREMISSFFDCVLLVKDYDSDTFETNDVLSSNADVPAMATAGIIDKPRNPFTGNDLSLLQDQKGEPELIYTNDWHIDTNNGNAFLPANWFTVKDDIQKADNWKYLGTKQIIYQLEEAPVLV